jgi:hypothetical protein
LQVDQQRAGYLLSIVQHLQGNSDLSRGRPELARAHYKESVRLLTDALKQTRWQAAAEEGRYRRAIHYNRACGQARLAELEGESAAGNTLGLAAIGDLEQTFPTGKQPDEQRKTDLQSDEKSGGDLFALTTRPAVKDAFAKIRKDVLG